MKWSARVAVRSLRREVTCIYPGYRRGQTNRHTFDLHDFIPEYPLRAILDLWDKHLGGIYRDSWVERR